MPDNELKIPIVTTADTSGAKATASALREVNDQTKKATAAAKEQAKAVNDLGENFEKGAAAGRVLSEASRGNILAFGQLGGAIKAIGALLRANLIGGLITLGAVAANILLPIIKGFLDKKKAVEDSTKAIDAATAAAKRFGEQRLETLKAELDGIARSADETVTALQNALADAKALADAQDQLELARLDADPSVSQADKVQRRAAIAARAADRNSASAVAQAEGVVVARRDVRDQTQALESSRATDLNEVMRTLDAIRQARAEANALIAETNREFVARVRQITATTREGSERQFAIGQAAEQTQLAQAPAVARLNLLNSPEQLEREASLKAQLAADTVALNTANEAALEAARKLTEAEANLARVRSQQAALGPVQAELRRVQTEAALGPARESDRRAQEAADEAAVRDGVLATVTTGARRFEGNVINVGRAARASGAAEVEAAARRALDAIGTTRDGTTEDEAREIAAAFAQLEAALMEKNQKSFALEALVKGLAKQVEILAGKVSANGR